MNRYLTLLPLVALLSLAYQPSPSMATPVAIECANMARTTQTVFVWGALINCDETPCGQNHAVNFSYSCSAPRDGYECVWGTDVIYRTVQYVCVPECMAIINNHPGDALVNSQCSGS